MFNWIASLVGQWGYPGIAFLMFAENVFPPIPSELIMPLAGFTAAQGAISLWGAIVAGTIGSLAGALLWFYIGRWVGTERLQRWAGRYGRLLTMTPGDVAAADRWFDRHGGKAVLIGRLVPGVRTLISVPAGISGMSLGRMLVYSAVGTALWTAFLTFAGYLLEGQYEKVSAWVNPVSDIIVAALVIGYLYRVATFGKRVRKETDAATDRRAGRSA
ncbi:membrane protein DedA with SNARE-associated domain [Palleronia aestuarii]|uniref:Membrane protein DedA with SNARE-associated domain n=1 Tax=Palleronia aestuarii TaxID=568105 RepID=A0A2W7NAY3_9RHOB|nr:DedA family protein [Palleronia aestuarii]PZX15277.1 membrane protein DedA with SNARE-associated domain [Palleronia aestuarii]